MTKNKSTISLVPEHTVMVKCMQFYIFLYSPLFGGSMAEHCVNYN